MALQLHAALYTELGMRCRRVKEVSVDLSVNMLRCCRKMLASV